MLLNLCFSLHGLGLEVSDFFFHVGSDSPNFLKWWISPDVALCPAVPCCKVPQLANVRVMLVGQQKAENSVRRLRVFFHFLSWKVVFLDWSNFFELVYVSVFINQQT